MKILKLIAENVKKLHAVEITPEGTLVTIAGKNGAGKSSVLDSIAYAMGGEKLVPAEPIRAGESEAKIVVDLGDLVVTRKFKRDRATVQPIDGPPEFGPTTSTLMVTNKKDGARHPSPQAVLDKLLGRLTFDPLAFARDDPKKQDETLRKLVGLDVSAIEEQRKNAFQQRAILKKTYEIKTAQLLALPTYKDAPGEETPLAEVSIELVRAEELRRFAEEAQRIADKALEAHRVNVNKADDVRAKIAELELRLAELRVQEASSTRAIEEGQQLLYTKVEDAKVAKANIPDMNVIRKRITEIEVSNAAVRANQRYAALAAETDAVGLQVQEQDSAVVDAEKTKRLMLATAAFPVPGLGLSDAGVTFNDLPFSQAGTAEQMRVSVAIGIALNPTLRVLLIRNGNLLDVDSLQAIAEQAKSEDIQLWVEWVTSDANGVSVMMEEGSVQVPALVNTEA